MRFTLSVSKSIRSGLLASTLLLTGCGKDLEAASDLAEVGSALSDAMKSIDESTNGGSFALAPMPVRTKSWSECLIPSAMADILPPGGGSSCLTASTLGSCSSGMRTRTFSNCTTFVGRLTHSGSITLTWRDSNGAVINACGNLVSGSSITRTVSRTVTNARGGVLTVSSSGVTAYDTSVSFGEGQRLTKTANGASVAILGMSRRANSASGARLFDLSTRTSQDLVYTGTNRANRTLVSGTLQIFHNLANYTVTLTPTNVTWSAGCDTPTSGTFRGTLSGSQSGEIEVRFTGCGTQTVVQTKDGESAEVESTSDTSES